MLPGQALRTITMDKPVSHIAAARLGGGGRSEVCVSPVGPLAFRREDLAERDPGETA